ncbi:MAG: hypothetical protein Q4A48_06415, partial [Bacillota bacterium]|nr:hypothetical protein [Bacillota bacterium]
STQAAYTIRPAAVEMPQGASLTYKGAEQTGVPASQDYDISANTATDAGSYTAILSLKDKENNTWNDGSTADKRIAWTIDPAKVKVPSGKTLTYNGKARTGVVTGVRYTIIGNKATKAGSYTATLTLKDKKNTTWSDGTVANKKVNWTIKKAANPLRVKGKTVKVKYSKLKKKAQTLTVTRVIKFKKKAGDKKIYKLSSANKGTKSFKKYFKINKKTGKVTVKKGLKKGTYRVTVKVKAAGNANYKASLYKKVTFKVRVR